MFIYVADRDNLFVIFLLIQNYIIQSKMVVSHQWCDLFSSTTAQLYATHRKRE
jgi:hypothetical protein